MKPVVPLPPRELRGPILQGVSRSFYLSMRVLPAAIRDPISLAYLLARATDTIADTADIPVATRLEALPKLIAAINGETRISAVDQFKESFAPQQQNPAERTLIESLSACLAWLSIMPSDDREDIRAVLRKITRGQTLDLQRFGEGTGVRALQTGAELDEYTYLVAGCVGEFWTRVCARHLPRFSDRSDDEMRTLGIAFGKGLQLTNILRDAGEDARNGRCYLPADELRAAGVAPEELAGAPAAARAVLDAWREKAERGLAAGIEYATAVRNTRVRIATALPAIIGIRTLRCLEDAGTRSLTERVKIPRTEVRAILLRTFITRASPKFLRAQLTRNSAAVSR